MANGSFVPKLTPIPQYSQQCSLSSRSSRGKPPVHILQSRCSVGCPESGIDGSLAKEGGSDITAAEHLYLPTYLPRTLVDALILETGILETQPRHSQNYITVSNILLNLPTGSNIISLSYFTCFPIITAPPSSPEKKNIYADSF